MQHDHLGVGVDALGRRQEPYLKGKVFLYLRRGDERQELDGALGIGRICGNAQEPAAERREPSSFELLPKAP